MLLYALHVTVETKPLNAWPHKPKVNYKKTQLLFSEEVKSTNTLIKTLIKK